MIRVKARLGTGTGRVEEDQSNQSWREIARLEEEQWWEKTISRKVVLGT
jgi:hypothetical protein